MSARLPGERPAAPGLAVGCGYQYRRPAAGRLSCAGLRPAEGAAARLFHWAGCFTIPLIFCAIPLEVCPSHRPVAAGVHKSAARFYKASGHASPLPVAAIRRAQKLRGTVKKKGSPAQ